MDRYKVINESRSAHCCFECTVVDTINDPDEIWGYPSVCECFDEESAKLICEALNEYQYDIR